MIFTLKYTNYLGVKLTILYDNSHIKFFKMGLARPYDLLRSLTSGRQINNFI